MLDNYQKILVAVDGSDNSHLAFKEAVEVAKRNQAQLFVLQVINDQTSAYSPFAYGEIIQNEQAIAEAEMEKYLRYADNHNLKKVTPLIRLENPKTSIAKIVPEKFEIDLIVIGATGRGVVNRMIVGSTTSYVVQHTHCNVLVVKKAATKE